VIYPDKLGLGFQITEEMFEDDESGKMRQMPAELGNSLRWANEVLWWSLLNDGDDTHLCSDGGYIFSTTHKTLKSQETQANKPASAGSLSLTTYEAMLEHFMTIKNASGAPVEFNPTTLIIPYSLIWKARELQLSELKPYTADNEKNPVNVMEHAGMNYFVSRYLTSTTAFFGLCAGQHDLRMIWRRKVAFKNSDDFRTGNALFKATERVKAACWNWQGVYANPGA
jgi:phage major head subunit gpT-like protein